MFVCVCYFLFTSATWKLNISLVHTYACTVAQFSATIYIYCDVWQYSLVNTPNQARSIQILCFDSLCSSVCLLDDWGGGHWLQQIGLQSQVGRNIQWLLPRITIASRLGYSVTCNHYCALSRPELTGVHVRVYCRWSNSVWALHRCLSQDLRELQMPLYRSAAI